MKVYALNASPRKGWNSDEMLDAFIKGVSETNPDIDGRRVALTFLSRTRLAPSPAPPACQGFLQPHRLRPSPAS